MSFQIEKGLFKRDFTDYHAILGVPVHAENKEIRKRYMRIAKKLHPDSSAINSEAEKKLANDILSKLVNPAYEKLSQEKERAEHAVMLRLKGQQAIGEAQMTEQVQSALARELAQASDLEPTYKKALEQLASQQYESLDRMQELTGEISELNLVYLMRTQSNGATANSTKPAAPASQAPAAKTAKQQPEEKKQQKKSPVEDYYRRAEELVEKENLSGAILELRDGLKLEPTNSKCHSLLGQIYLEQKQTTMAKVHINKALELNPKEEKALAAKKNLEKLMAKKKAAGKSDGKSGKKSGSDGGGITIFGIKIGGGGSKKK
ncbi:MAG: DnaJ domain-containing protein [Hormoscilla sp.]